MFKKFLSTMLVLAFLNVSANVQTQELSQLAKAYQNLNFSLSVEWDQKDQTFYNAEMEKFTAEVKKLQNTGLDNDAIIKFLKTELKGQKIAKDIDALLGVVKVNKLSQTEARKFLLETVSQSYPEGLSYRGRRSFASPLLILIIVVAIIAVADTSYYGGSTGGCYDEYVCDDYYGGYYNDWLYSDCYYTTYCY